MEKAPNQRVGARHCAAWAWGILSASVLVAAFACVEKVGALAEPAWRVSSAPSPVVSPAPIAIAAGDALLDFKITKSKICQYKKIRVYEKIRKVFFDKPRKTHRSSGVDNGSGRYR
jgi:hypothetical protein